MFEQETFYNILQRLLNKVPSDVDKRQGAIIYDTLAPVSAELAQAYILLDFVLKEGFADTASREYLIKRAMERGLYPYGATHAIVLAKLEGNVNLSGGERFNLEDVNYFYTGEKEEEYYKLKCEEAGTIGNLHYGELLPIDNIPNLKKAYIFNLLTAGTDEEDTEVFRKRYFASFKNQAFGGNRADYKEKLKSLNKKEAILNNGGVGGIKLYRTPNGGGTVEVFITSNSYNVPSSKLVDLVQQEIDPIDETGEGYGIAPIGHFVTIKPVLSQTINIQTILELKEGFILDDVMPYIQNKIEDYFDELRKSWEDEQNIIVRLSKIESLILEVNGVIDINNTYINGNAINLSIGKNTIPIKGEIICN